MQFAGCLMILNQEVLKSRENSYFERFFGLIPRFSLKSEVDIKGMERLLERFALFMQAIRVIPLMNALLKL
jgi:hypothetical protein